MDDDRRLREIRLQLLWMVWKLAGRTQPLDLDVAASKLAVSTGRITWELSELVRTGLTVPSPDESRAPLVTQAGCQYLARSGTVREDVLNFLPDYVDDLQAREALLDAGAVIFDGFREAMLSGTSVARSRSLVPPHAAEAMDMRMTVDMLAAASAVIVRSTIGQPPACVAEAMIFAAVIGEAESLLQARHGAAELLGTDIAVATAALFGAYDLLPPDLLAHCDERAGASRGCETIAPYDTWFEAFGETSVTGHLTRTGPERPQREDAHDSADAVACLGFATPARL